jgi:Ankyrin repeats (3 copies)
MARKKAQRKQPETTLVHHRAPNLSALLDRAKLGESAQHVAAYLGAGGSARALVAVEGEPLQIPLLQYMALYNQHPHTELAECVRLLVAAGADSNLIAVVSAEGDERTALMCAAERTCCTAVPGVLLQAGADPCVRPWKKGVTALHIAAGSERYQWSNSTDARNSSWSFRQCKATTQTGCRCQHSR